MTTPNEASSNRVRLTILVVVAICLFGALFARLAFLQVINAPAAQDVATVNGVRYIYTQAPRGEILDADGNVLVGNRTSEVIQVQRQEAASDPGMESRLAILLGMTTKELRTDLGNSQFSPYAPVPVETDAPPSQILYIQEHQSLFPGVSAATETLRSYTPAGAAAANLVGYVGAISQSEYAQVSHKIYQPGFQVGLTGIEAEYESVLRGTPGVETVQVNAQGQVLGAIHDTPPVPGDNLKLTIQGPIQMAADEALVQGQAAARGEYDPVTHRNFDAPGAAAVVEDPKNGTIVALATEPTYDPDEFVGGISDAQYAALKAPSANDPLLDRAIQGEYAPGSTFKLVTATAALNAGLITPSSTYDDTGSLTIGDEVFHDDDDVGSGVINVTQALTVSSDNFFNFLGAEFWDDRARFGSQALQDTAFQYGFGYRSGIKLPDELPGLVPTPKTVEEDYKEHPSLYDTGTWYTGDSAQIAIGQFEDEVTPLQLANAYSTFANGGTRYVPRLAVDEQTPGGRLLKAYASGVAAHVSLSPANRAAMLAGFEGVAQSSSGTAAAVFAGTPLAKMDIAGKTGTAQVQAPKQNTSVFTSFAPATDPQYEVTAIMEESGYGATIAGPVVRQIYDALYHLKPQPITVVATSGAQT